MRLVAVSEIFEVQYGTGLELNALEETPAGVPFVSRTTRNNGVSATVATIDGVDPIRGGVLSVALGGTPMTTFFQDRPFYAGRDVAYLVAKLPMKRDVLVYYALCLRANRFRFSYGRQANRSLGALLVPSPADIPAWVRERMPTDLDRLVESGVATPSKMPLKTAHWQPFNLTDLFDIVRGKGPSLAEAKENPGTTPYVTASEKNNGIATWTSAHTEHPAGCLTVATNGSVGECFFQPEPFAASADVAVLVPKRSMPREALLFIATLIRREGKLKYGYGRKWGAKRMAESVVRLPATTSSEVDCIAMTELARSLPSFKLLGRLGQDRLNNSQEC